MRDRGLPTRPRLTNAMSRSCRVCGARGRFNAGRSRSESHGHAARSQAHANDRHDVRRGLFQCSSFSVLRVVPFGVGIGCRTGAPLLGYGQGLSQSRGRTERSANPLRNGAMREGPVLKIRLFPAPGDEKGGVAGGGLGVPPQVDARAAASLHRGSILNLRVRGCGNIEPEVGFSTQHPECSRGRRMS
jgi:hypothetical protein